MQLVLTFRLADELYGLDIADVQEIVEAPQRYFIPNAPPSYAGAINFHGAIVPVLDLAALLDLAAMDLDHRVIVLHPGHCALAFAVTRLHRIVRIEVEESLPCDPERHRQTCIRELLNHEDEMINLLDVALLLERLEVNEQSLEVADGL